MGMALLSTLGCNANTLRGDEKSSTASKDSEAPDDETIVPPAQITGTSLHCLEEAPSSNERADVLYGCAISDANGYRREIGALDFGWRAPSGSPLIAYISLTPDDGRYHVLYYFRSNDTVTLRAEILKVGLIIQGEGVEGGMAGVQLTETIVPDSFFLETSDRDFEAIRNQISTGADKDAPSPPTP